MGASLTASNEGKKDTPGGCFVLKGDITIRSLAPIISVWPWNLNAYDPQVRTDTVPPIRVGKEDSLLFLLGRVGVQSCSGRTGLHEHSGIYGLGH